MTNWQILPMFARPIAITKIDDEKTKAVQKLASKVMWFASKEQQDIEIAYSKKDNILKGELQEYFLDLAADLIGEFGYQCDIQMTRSYFRKSDPSGFTWEDCNPGSWFTAIFWWEDYAEESGGIKFSCDPDPYGQPKEWNVWSSPWIDIYPNAGALCIFPSTMRNRLIVNQSETSRKELMFHFVPK